jgi:glycosyltransferase involved in cell wall biosynthesis
MVEVSFITFTKNSAHRLRELLEHVKDIVDEIIVVDGYSTDETVDVARSYGARVYERRPWGYPDPDRTFALKQASHNWILMLDDDERLCSRLKKELKSIIEDCSTHFAAIDVLRINLAKDNKIILAPYYPDRVVKIFRRDKTIFTGRVHDGPRISGPTYHLPDEYYLIHLPYHEDNWLKKAMIYAYYQNIQYPSIIGGNILRRALIKSLPLTTIPYYLYMMATLIKRKVPINSLSPRYCFRRALYDSILQTLIKLRNEKKKELARKISEIGFSRFLGIE